jgi:hypothetical protein
MDIINAMFELGGLIAILFSIRQVLKDKQVKGIHWATVALFATWGFWNLFFYSGLAQWFSFGAAACLGVAQFAYVALLIYFSRRSNEQKRYDEIGDDWIETYTGIIFNIDNPTKDMIRIEDIAHGLAYECRYNGHTKRFYSVAEHCCVLSDYVLDITKDPHKALHMLLHDAAEAYTSDVPRPIKKTVPEFRELENRIEAVVLAALGLPADMPNWMEILDNTVIKDERMAVMGNSGNVWKADSMQPLGVKFPGYSPDEAEEAFMNRYNKLKIEIMNWS